jgi:hypothetical protein
VSKESLHSQEPEPGQSCSKFVTVCTSCFDEVIKEGNQIVANSVPRKHFCPSPYSVVSNPVECLVWYQFQNGFSECCDCVDGEIRDTTSIMPWMTG